MAMNILFYFIHPNHQARGWLHWGLVLLEIFLAWWEPACTNFHQEDFSSGSFHRFQRQAHEFCITIIIFFIIFTIITIIIIFMVTCEGRSAAILWALYLLFLAASLALYSLSKSVSTCLLRETLAENLKLLNCTNFGLFFLYFCLLLSSVVSWTLVVVAILIITE